MLHDPFAQKVVCSHFALTVLFQSDSIGLSHRRARRARATFPFYAARMKDSALLTSADDVMVFIIYH